MNAEELSRIQDSGAQVQCGGVIGTVDGFRVSGDEIRSLRLRDEAGDIHEVGGAVDVVDEVDDEKVAEVRAARVAQDAAFLAKSRV